MKWLTNSMFAWKLRILWGTFALDSRGAKFGKLTSVAIILAFSLGGVIFFKSVFIRMEAIEGIGEPLLWRVVNITLMTLFALLMVSNLITGIATLYRSTQISFLMSRPISYGDIFISRFLDNLAYSSWSLVVLGIPFVVAFGQAFGMSVWGMGLLLLFGFIPMVLIAAEIGAFLLVCLIFLAKFTSPRLVVFLVTVTIALLIGWVIGTKTPGMVLDSVSGRMSAANQYLFNLAHDTGAPVTPSRWMARAMQAVRVGDLRRGGLYLALITLSSLVWLYWLKLWGEKVYYNSWTTFSEMLGPRKIKTTGASAARFTRSWIPNPLNALLRKDLLMFVRSPGQWAQFLILVAFLLIYLLNLVFVSSRFFLGSPYWKTLVLFLNFAFTGFILATLSVRFVFPLISLEGKGFWVVRSSPVTVDTLFWEKFFLSFVIFMGLCELVVFFSNRVLNITGPMMAVTTAATFTMGVSLTGLAIGMGALFPVFRDESPMRIASTPGGVLTVVISLVYVGLMVGIIAWPTQGYFMYLADQGPLPFRRALQALALVAGLNALVLLLPVSQGRHSLNTKDL